MKVVAFILFSLVLVSCSTSLYPSWYVNFTNYDESYLYGVGSSSNLKTAKMLAVDDMASQISVIIESDARVSYERVDSNLSSSASSSILLSIDDITIDGLEYPIIDNVNGLFFVQSRVKKSKILNRLNFVLNNYIIDAKNILNNMDRSCSISPKQKRDLALSLDNINLCTSKIMALGGNIIHSKLINDINLLLSTKSAAYYVEDITNTADSNLLRISSAVMQEYGKFFIIDSKDPKKYTIFNKYNTNYDGINSYILLDTYIKDCNGNVIFSAHINEAYDNIDLAIRRVAARLYKSINSWIEM